MSEVLDNTFIVGLIGLFVGSTLTGLVSYIVNKKTEDQKSKRKIVEESQRIAELFASWVKYNSVGISTKELKGENLAKYYYQLNKLTWEFLLWAPEEQVVLDIMKRLHNEDDAKDIRQILLDVREMLQGKKNKTLRFSEIVFFQKKERKQKTI